MPNHCTNRLFCTNASLESVIKPFMSNDKYGHSFLDFNKIIPMPEDGTNDEELKEDWQVSHWGTKWNSYDVNTDNDNCSFYTAWSPPIPVITELAKITGKDFVLEYLDEGGGFVGKLTATPQEVIDECYNSIEEAPQELLESLGYEPYE